ncbi:crotonase/enoyl-CoA hydratase family protein [Mangrovicella endophytica]|uniref:crotonase/enoyl-CoA hydratase family protein n=1 Tax=Mangrovicella endophytica TaxID=2066697 RepID=UPI000C9E844A|nr:crotonase/enoyl-CoA hydratase family protein [Mangrovicella endophytica]
MSAHIEVTSADGVVTIRMNRPDKKNAIDRAMYGAMAAAIADAGEHDEVAAILLCGLPGVFTAGNDIRDFLDAVAEDARLGHEVEAFLQALATAEKPLVAAVDGIAIGIGTTMLMHCDLVYASPRASFRTPFLDLGVTPEAGSSLLAPRLMGYQQAFALLVLGETFDADAAKAAGLVTTVVDADTVEAVARDTALRLAGKPREALQLSRRLMRGERSEVLRRIAEENAIFAERLRSREARAAFRAFLDR